MKRNIMIGALVLVVGSSIAQYGSIEYGHSGMYLTSARTTNNTSGFIKGAVNPGATGTTQPDFVINKTDLNGNFPGATEFTREFYIGADDACSCAGTCIVPHHGCNGIDIAEANSGATEKYVVTGTFDEGLFFFQLNSSGSLIGTTQYWPVTDGTISERPRVRASATSGIYYMCGTVGGRPYIIKMSTATGQVWAKTITNMTFEPYAIIERPGSTSEIVVVGMCQYDAALAQEAFFLRMNANTGGVIAFNTYSDGTGGDEWFTSIEAAASTAAGGSGYIVGGRVHSYNSALAGYHPWMAKLDYNGNALWSTLISSGSTLEITDVMERENGVTSPYPYEYYGVGFTPGATANDISVWKLDDNGTETSHNPDVFKYTLGTLVAGQTDYTVPQIEVVGNGQQAGDGFAAWATEYSGSINKLVLIKAWFNGVNGCDNQGDMVTATGPGVYDTPTLNTANLSSPCIYFYANSFGTGITEGDYCGTWGPQSGGTNARTKNLVTLGEYTPAAADWFTVHPNPTSGASAVTISLATESPTEIVLTNSIGQVIKRFDQAKTSETGKSFELNFGQLGLPQGLYFLNATTEGRITTRKIIHNK